MVLVVVLLGVVFTYQAFSELNDDIQADAGMSEDAKSAARATVDNYPSQMDNAFFFLFFMLWMFLLIAGFFASTHPVFAGISVILILFGLVVVMLLANTYEETTLDAEVSAAASEFTKMDWILDHLLGVFIIMGLSVLLVLYARSSL
jgi:hypothetical protein